MDIRKSAVHLSTEERDRFLEALIRLKHRPAPSGVAGLSRYDQFVALHGAVFAVLAPGLPPGETVNFGHWNIGFCAWHRQYVREFEKALQAEVAGVTVPYWDWTDHVGAVDTLFTGEFLGSLRVGAPGPMIDSVLRNPVPTADRPAWWPAQADGFLIHPLLEDGFGSVLARGSAGIGWPPTGAQIAALERLVIVQPDVHPFWFFWAILEEGHPQIPRTHNTGHNFIGGHMSQGFSPNDPIFWLHHSNVDRLWANWQARRLGDVPASTRQDHYPPADQVVSPFDGRPIPPGHGLNDTMWPWVGDEPGFDVDIDPAVKPLLPDFSDAPPVTVADVLDTETIDEVGYRYAPPGA